MLSMGVLNFLLRARSVSLKAGVRPGLREALPWISRDATNLHVVPGRVVIVGGGVVACEAATWLNDLGAQVTIEILTNHRLEFEHQCVSDGFDSHESNYNPRTQLS